MKFCGNVGFVYQAETEPGIIGNIVAERTYYGDVLKNFRKWIDRDKINDDIVCNNEISIIADSFATENFGAMRYVEYLGQKWKIATAEIEYPRIVLTLGGLYNGAED